MQTFGLRVLDLNAELNPELVHFRGDAVGLLNHLREQGAQFVVAWDRQIAETIRAASACEAIAPPSEPFPYVGRFQSLLRGGGYSAQ
jgi:hypothetical protein